MAVCQSRFAVIVSYCLSQRAQLEGKEADPEGINPSADSSVTGKRLGFKVGEFSFSASGC